jgi:glutamate 5-kinase
LASCLLYSTSYLLKMAQQLPHKQQLLAAVRRVVLKVGSSILSTPEGIDRIRLCRLADEIHMLRSRGYQVVLVSSGAVAAGMARLGKRERPNTIPQKQAAAAIGQIGLMALYEEFLGGHGHVVAQVLLTHDDLANRRRYINARHTFEELLQAGAVPVVNENDTVAVEEFKYNFGDNDNLSALVATLVSADVLVILSDVVGLCTADPRISPEAKLIPLVRNFDSEVEGYVRGPAGPVGTGGMASKLKAAYKTTDAGIPCVIADGLSAGVVAAIFDPTQSVGTLFLPKGDRLKRRKHWIAHVLQPVGTLVVDQGAYDALATQGRSLLPKGIVEVNGEFEAGECVSCLTPEREEFARGLVGYGSTELAKIKGAHTSEIEGRLGYNAGNAIIHRDDLVLLRG